MWKLHASWIGSSLALDSTIVDHFRDEAFTIHWTPPQTTTQRQVAPPIYGCVHDWFAALLPFHAMDLFPCVSEHSHFIRHTANYSGIIIITISCIYRDHRNAIDHIAIFSYSIKVTRQPMCKVKICVVCVDITAAVTKSSTSVDR